MNKSWTSGEWIVNKPWTSCQQVMNKSWTSSEQVIQKLWTSPEQIVNKLWRSCEDVVNKLLANCEISAIFQLLMTRFWPNFKDRFLGPSLTDANCHCDIWPGKNCLGDICSYQGYVSWPADLCQNWQCFKRLLKAYILSSYMYRPFHWGGANIF